MEEPFSSRELSEALRAINSMLAKCQKALPKLREGSPQRTLLVRRVRAFEVAVALLERELARQDP